MRRTLLAAAAVLPAFAASAFAETAPTPGKLDSRIRMAAYNPMQVLNVVATGSTPVEIDYEPGEQIVAVSGLNVDLKPVCGGDKGCGDAQKWEPSSHTWVAIASDNTLTLDPEMDPPAAVLSVRTSSRDGEQRLYSYQLNTRAGSLTNKNDKLAYMKVVYTYVHKATPQEIAAAQARRYDAAERLAHTRLVQDQAAAPQNREYEKRGDGCSYLAPRSTTDDGIRTRMVFATGTQIPAILHVIPNGTTNGEEATLTVAPETAADGLVVTLPTVYPELRLRYGNKLVCGLRPKPATQAASR